MDRRVRWVHVLTPFCAATAWYAAMAEVRRSGGVGLFRKASRESCIGNIASGRDPEQAKPIGRGVTFPRRKWRNVPPFNTFLRKDEIL